MDIKELIGTRGLILELDPGGGLTEEQARFVGDTVLKLLETYDGTARWCMGQKPTEYPSGSSNLTFVLSNKSVSITTSSEPMNKDAYRDSFYTFYTVHKFLYELGWSFNSH